MSARPAGLVFSMIETMRQLEADLEQVLEGVGLSLAKYGVVSKLAEAGEPLPLSTLAERVSCVRSNITQLVDRLEDEHLVERVADAHDRRSVRARLTEAGRARHDDAVRALHDAEQHLLGRLDPAGREALIHVLRSLKAA